MLYMALASCTLAHIAPIGLRMRRIEAHLGVSMRIQGAGRFKKKLLACMQLLASQSHIMLIIGLDVRQGE